MKKLLFFVMLAMVLSLVACGKETSTDIENTESIATESVENAGNFEIPDVFGIRYSDAKKILEAEGFEVTVIRTGVKDISIKLLYPLKEVSQGIVFKIDSYIIDGIGNLTKNYSILHGDECEMVSKDKSVIIYYAKEDYAE